MTNEEKQLLLKDLSARLPHGVICDRLGHPKKLLSVSPYKKYPLEFDNGEYMPSHFKVEDIKPYLRPMSSMTKEEKIARDYYCGYKLYYEEEDCGKSYLTECDMPDYMDWLLSKHFDFRGLIPMGLAIEAPEDMYK